MSERYIWLAQTFGPLVQLFFVCGLLLLFGFFIGGFSYFGVRKLFKLRNRFLIRISFFVFMIGIVYGGLRFSGLLIYPADGWDSTGPWNYTNQNHGAVTIYVCLCLLVGAFLAKRKNTRCQAQIH